MRTLLSGLLQTTLLVLCAPAWAQSQDPGVPELQREVRQLSNRVQQLEQLLEEALKRLDAAESIRDQQKVVVKQSPTLAPQETQRSQVTLGGRVKADAIISSVSSGGAGGNSRLDTAFLPGIIPLTNLGEKNELSSSARDSRFWINARTHTERGDLGAYLELDFVSSDGSGNERVSNSYNPRLRHAYGTFRNVTVGQTTTTFLNSLAFPELNDANGPVGITNVRQPLLRHSWLDGQRRWTLALEQPETTITSSTGSRLSNDDDRVPDVIGRLDVDGDWGNWSLALLLRQLRVDSGTTSNEERGVGLSTAGRIFTSDVNNIRFSLTVGEGIGRYVSYNAFNDAIMVAGEGIKPVSVLSGYLAYQHWWLSHLRSNWVIGFANADIDTSMVADTVNESLISSHVNLLWSPVPEATIGLEWLYGERKLANGTTGNLNRLQITSLYKFRRR